MIKNLERLDYKIVSSINDIEGYNCLPIIKLGKSSRVFQNLVTKKYYKDLSIGLDDIISPHVLSVNFNKEIEDCIELRFWKDSKKLAKMMVLSIIDEFKYVPNNILKDCIETSNAYNNILGCCTFIDEKQLLESLLEGFNDINELNCSNSFDLVAEVNDVNFKKAVNLINVELISTLENLEDVSMTSGELMKFTEEHDFMVRFMLKSIMFYVKSEDKPMCVGESNLGDNLVTLLDIAGTSETPLNGIRFDLYPNLIKSMKKLKGFTPLRTLQALNKHLPLVIDCRTTQPEVDYRFELVTNEILKKALELDIDNSLDIITEAVDNYI